MIKIGLLVSIFLMLGAMFGLFISTFGNYNDNKKCFSCFNPISVISFLLFCISLYSAFTFADKIEEQKRTSKIEIEDKKWVQ